MAASKNAQNEDRASRSGGGAAYDVARPQFGEALLHGVARPPRAAARRVPHAVDWRVPAPGLRWRLRRHGKPGQPSLLQP